MDKVIAWWLQFVNNMNEKGIPVPMARVNGKPSVTGSLVIISAALVALPILIMVATVVTRIGGWFTLNEANQAQLMNAFSAAIQMHIAALGGYLGRGMQRDSTGKVAVDAGKPEKPE
jgi:hypothetical protein